MSVWANYKCEGQLTFDDVFDYLKELKPKPFSWDDDINEIHRRLEVLVKKHGLSQGKTDWEVWSHVPQYGYRMTFTIVVTREKNQSDDFWEDVHEIVDAAKSKKVEISPTMPFFFTGSNTASIYVFSTFMDQERRKIKK